MPDNDPQPETVVLGADLLIAYRDRLGAIRQQLRVILGAEHPSVVLLGEAGEKLAEPGTLPHRGPDHPSGYAAYTVGPGQSEEGRE
ncbi:MULTISPECIES: hypothetical protein [unclassified Nocardia]|uniref:hypothetical protein n=1 Tax=unclassified Nocardia TaxID=2637762 RepID=UPI00278C72E0|nr:MULTISPECIES: hypothetical protein [unclassified Nocardia]